MTSPRKGERPTPGRLALRGDFATIAEKIELTFWFIRNDAETNFKGTSWEDLVKKWMKLVPESAVFSPVHGVVVTLEDMKAADYVESDLLDLDHLSQG